jgi:hypothetical protein
MDDGFKIQFIGGLKLDIGAQGVDVAGQFGFQGRWNDPLYMGKALTVWSAGVKIGMQLTPIAPKQFGFNLQASMDAGKHGSSSINGCLDINLETTNSAAYLNAKNLSLAIALYGFFPDLPDSLEDLLKVATIQDLELAINLGTSAVMLCSQQIAAGTKIAVRDFDLFWGLIGVKSAEFFLSTDLKAPGFRAGFELEPFTLGSVLSLTSVNDATRGPRAMVALNKTGFLLDASARLNVLGCT